jgi:hypothetical protein
MRTGLPAAEKGDDMFSASGFMRAFTGVFAAFRRVLRLGRA